MSKLKCLFVGLGGIGQRHLRNLRSLLGDQTEVLAYRVRRRDFVLTDQLTIEPNARLEDKYNIRTFSDLDVVLEQSPQVAFICNPTSLHMPIALKLAEAGCHLLIEKPLSHSVEGVEQLIRLVDQKGVVGFVGYQLRFHPMIAAIRQWLNAGVIGRVLAVRVEVGERLTDWHKYENYRDMYASRRDLGGGVILTQIHEIDYLYSFFGSPARVFALGGHLSSLEVDVEDVASILMEYRIEERIVPVHLHQDYVQRPPSRGCQIIGDEGKIMMDLRANVVERFEIQTGYVETRSYRDFPRNKLFLDEMRHFLACVEGKEQPVVSLRDGANSLNIALAAKRSLETGLPVDLGEGS